MMKSIYFVLHNNRIVILNSNGKILWDLESDHSFYRVYYIDKNNLFFNQKIKFLTKPINELL